MPLPVPPWLGRAAVIGEGQRIFVGSQCVADPCPELQRADAAGIASSRPITARLACLLKCKGEVSCLDLGTTHGSIIALR